MPPETQHRSAIEARFAQVFAHLGLLSAYARRRGARDPDAIAAEAMAIAWRRLADVPRDDPRPWLIATARNLVLADRRRYAAVLQDLKGVEPAAPPQTAIRELDHELEVALATLSDTDRGALLLVAWEDLTPSAASVRPDRRLPRRCPARPSPPAAHRHPRSGPARRRGGAMRSWRNRRCRPAADACQPEGPVRG